MGGSSAPKAPEYTWLIDAAKQQATSSATLSRQQSTLAKQAYNRTSRLTENIIQDNNARANSMDAQANQANAWAQRDQQWAADANSRAAEDDQTAAGIRDWAAQTRAEAEQTRDWAGRDRAYYESTVLPNVTELTDFARNYDTPEQREQNRSLAMGDVANSFAGARDAAIKDLESYGINPGAVRYAGLDAGMQVKAAAAKAAAGTQADISTRLTGQQLRTNAAQIGQAIPTQSINELNTSVAQQNAAATQTGLAAQEQGVAQNERQIGIAQQGAAAQQQGAAANFASVGNQANAGSAYANAQKVAGGFQTMGAPTQWAYLGTQGLTNLATITAADFQNKLGSYNAEQNSSSGIGSMLGGVAGLATAFLDEGGAVPEASSPSGGQAIDDVPAQLTAGEFVIPEDAVRWMGEAQLYKLIAKARKDKQMAAQGAIPMPGEGQQPQQAPQAMAEGGSVLDDAGKAHLLQFERGYMT
jgi:hypothetical protein